MATLVVVPDLTASVVLESFPIARGGFADVYKGRLGDQMVAAKVIRHFGSQLEPSEAKKSTKRINRELRIWRKLEHPNVLPLLGTLQREIRGEKLPVMVCPWMDGGNLNGLFNGRNSKVVSPQDRIRIILAVAEGLAYLHSHENKIIHGDLSGANVLLTSGLEEVRLSDFGMSTIAGVNSAYQTSAPGGSMRWCAPERIPGITSTSYIATTESDIYSLGSVCLQVLSGKIPYHYLPGEGEVLFALKNRRLPKRKHTGSIAETHWRFLKTCWAKPESRPLANVARDKIRSFFTSCSEPDEATNEESPSRDISPSPPSRPSPLLSPDSFTMSLCKLPPCTTHKEVWLFLNRCDSTRTSNLESCIISIFVTIKNWAFVSFQNEGDLQHAIEHCAGQKWTADNPQSPTIICRCLTSVVDRYQGTGMYVRNPQHRGNGTECADSGPLRSDDDFTLDRLLVLAPYFTKRYFVLKSSSKDALCESVRTQQWRTQPHVEKVLNQAYQTSEVVYLIFSGNQSREFFGYAQMAGMIPKRTSNKSTNGQAQRTSPDLGEPFFIRWIRNGHPLALNATTSLTDNWHPMQAIKASRDGTELSPETGEMLLDMFW